MNISKNGLLCEVVNQKKTWLAFCPDRTDRKVPMCYIRLKEVGGSNEFWAKMTGDNALLVFKPGQKVEVELSFHIHKNSRKISQRVTVNKISLVQNEKRNKSRIPLPWEDDFDAPWEV